MVNLETEGLNADFTGTLIDAKKPVTVFVGSEASDVPIFGDYTTRQCCADHLEEQLIPDSTLGNRFIIARTNSRTRALAAAAFPDDPLGIAIVNEPEWVRVIAVEPGHDHDHDHAAAARRQLPPASGRGHDPARRSGLPARRRQAGVGDAGDGQPERDRHTARGIRAAIRR